MTRGKDTKFEEPVEGLLNVKAEPWHRIDHEPGSQ